MREDRETVREEIVTGYCPRCETDRQTHTHTYRQLVGSDRVEVYRMIDRLTTDEQAHIQTDRLTGRRLTDRADRQEAD